MSWPILALAGALVVLVAIQMLRPRFLRRAISSIRFFRSLPPPKSQSRLALQAPWPTRLFWLRLAAWSLALIALLVTERVGRTPRVDRLGLWLWLDTSASLTARQGTGNRWAQAVRATASWADRLAVQYPAAQIEWRLTAFDEVRRDIAIAGGKAEDLKAALRSLEPRALGTNLHLVAAASSVPTTLASGQPVTHVIVVSDAPRPGIFADAIVPVVWEEIGSSTSNTGFTALTPTRDPFTGAVARMRLSLQRSGATEETPCILSVRAPGKMEDTLLPPLTWRSDGYSEIDLPTPLAGLYEVRITGSGGGACTFDDAISFKVPPIRTVRVDWRAAQPDWPKQLGWQESNAGDIDLRVISLAEATRMPRDDVPLLILAPTETQGRSERINLFDDGHPLLADINLDGLEREIPPFPIPADFGGQIVVRASPGRGWVAIRPHVCLIPAPPPLAAADSVATRVRHTLFFNAIKHLMVEKPLPPLFSVTNPTNPVPAIPLAHLALHSEEGLTLKHRPPPAPDTLEPFATASSGERESQWPPWVAFASVVAALEASLALAGGGRWS